MAECKRLGFVYEDEQGVLSLSFAGLGYLLLVRAQNVTSPAEAFAAGYQCARGKRLERDRAFYFPEVPLGSLIA